MLTLTVDTDSYAPWSGAVATYNTLCEYNMLTNFYDALGDLYPNGLSDARLNDILWFEPEFCYELVGLNLDDELEENAD